MLVESDPHNAALARQGADEAGLSQVEVRAADASRVANYADALPADVLLLCGIFGNVSEDDIQRTAQAAPALCAAGATVIWTRHRRAPDLTPRDPRVVPRERVRGGGLRHAGHRGADRCRRRPPGRRPAGRAAARPAVHLPPRLIFRQYADARDRASARRMGAIGNHPSPRAAVADARAAGRTVAGAPFCARRRGLPGSGPW